MENALDLTTRRPRKASSDASSVIINKKVWEWQSVEFATMGKTGACVCIFIFICIQIQFAYVYKYKYKKMWGWEWQSAELATMGKTRVSGKTKNM